MSFYPYLIAALFSFLLLDGLQAQQEGWMIEPTFHYGKILKHTPKLLFTIDEPSYAFELAFKKQTLGQKDWQALQGYPTLGLSLMAYQMGPADTLGQAFSLTPNLNVYLFRRPKWDTQFMLGYGLAYLNKPFNVVNNPINNAIGSRVNATVQLRLLGHIKLRPHWWLKTGCSFTHYSNGASQLPNFGLNILGGVLGLRYVPKVWSPERLQKPAPDQRKATKRFGLDWNMGVGYKERGAAGGPRSPIYLVSVAGTFASNKINQFLLGAEYEYNQGAYLFGQHVGEFDSKREGRLRSMRTMVFVGDEMNFGDFSVSMQLGLYLHKVYLGVFPVYNRFVIRYYLPPLRQPAARFYVALQLKSHLINAEYFSLSGGIRF